MTLDIQSQFSQIVDCSADPFDLRPAVKAIADRVEQKRRKQPGKTVFVAIGEVHTLPTHVLLPAYLIKHLSDQGLRVAYGEEKNNNDLKGRTITSTIPNVPQEINDKLTNALTEEWQKIRDENKPLMMLAGGDLSGFATQAHATKASYFLDKSIPVGWNDSPISKDNDELIDLKDPQVKKNLERYFRFDYVVNDIETSSLPGLALRNFSMVQLGQEHAASVEAEVYVQHTGLEHLLGRIRPESREPSELFYKGSLASIYKTHGMDPVLVFPNSAAFPANEIPAAASVALSEAICLQGLAEDTFATLGPKQGVYDFDKEAAFIKKIHDHSGQGVPLIDFWPKMKEAEAMLMQRLRARKAETAKALGIA